MKTIIVPTDLSPDTDAALSVAVDIARLYQASIVLLHNVVYPNPVPVYSEAILITNDYMLAEYQEVEKEAEVALKRIAEDKKYSGVTIIPTLITNGMGLVHNVTERPADLIVMSSEGASGLEEFLLGSNAETIVRHAHCPVLVVKEPIAHFKPENIVCGIDVDNHLKALHHYPFQLGENGLHQFVYVMTPTDNRDTDGVREWVNDFAATKGITDFKFVIHPARNVPDGIIDYANEVNADLIVLFTHGYKGLRHLVSGSVAEDVLNHTSRPVLIMRVIE
ncbi:universal stress protein [Spirosoma pollinicola]|uniref:Universal stress protein UspA n=1 Tax=Spirosoma pollinicola TaxID=2057025 RepID=A0A2K8Z377_9BACT|nr:universal stress protein [Spirosoma pollinicola]AUD04274.1 universal stress protein UspA [Spirosoma pollinicola]